MSQPTDRPAVAVDSNAGSQCVSDRTGGLSNEAGSRFPASVVALTQLHEGRDPTTFNSLVRSPNSWIREHTNLSRAGRGDAALNLRV
jgi:hypothetical protein